MILDDGAQLIRKVISSGISPHFSFVESSPITLPWVASSLVNSFSL